MENLDTMKIELPQLANMYGALENSENRVNMNKFKKGLIDKYKISENDLEESINLIVTDKKINRNSFTSEILSKEWERLASEAMCDWLMEKTTYQELKNCPYIKDLLLSDSRNQRLEACINIFKMNITGCHSFFRLIYNEDGQFIIDKLQEGPDSADNYNLLENVFMKLDIQGKGGRESIPDKIIKYHEQCCQQINEYKYKKIVKDKDHIAEDKLMNVVLQANDHRNNLHPGKFEKLSKKQQKDTPIMLRRRLAESLFIFSVLENLKNQSHPDGIETERSGENKPENIINEEEYNDRLQKWFKNHEGLFSTLIDDTDKCKNSKNNIISIAKSDSDVWRYLTSVLNNINKEGDFTPLPDNANDISLAKDVQKKFLECAIRKIRGIPDEDIQDDFTNNVKLLRKYSRHISRIKSLIFSELSEDFDDDKSDYTQYINDIFIKSFFLISYVQEQVLDAITGIVFYSNDKLQIIYKRESKEDKNFELQTRNPQFRTIYIKELKSNKKTSKSEEIVTINASLGDRIKVEESVTIKKGSWYLAFCNFEDCNNPKIEFKEQTYTPCKWFDEEDRLIIEEELIKKPDGEEITVSEPQESDSRVKENEQKFFDYVQGQKKQLLETYKKEILLANKEAKELDELKYNERMTLEGNYNVVDSQITIVKAKIDVELKKQEDSKKALEREAQRKELEKKFEKEKEETLSGLKNLYVNTNVIRDCKEQAIKNIQELCYDHTISSEENKNKIVEIDKNCRAEIVRLEENRLINKLNKWLNKNWKWCLGMIAFVVLFFVLMNIGNSDGRMTVPEGKAVPSLESNKWTVPLMDGNNVNELATISSIDGSDSHYNIHIIDGNGKEINATIRVDWQNGIVMSPELGEGKVVENNKMKSINLIFEKWKFTKNY